ncbi:hypothetical protein FE257_001757 [Aspergillus nanangensis]|uniref:Mitochondrial division protein 1 n=1 Tax=Aspergillus nanangensis TaxID=2582783 RepID=A0AAD4GPG7_ASPNN|nr:hypothetical protein FE257_001757 [Aspergillus nanangensis]
MAGIPDLVRDSKLETRFLHTETVHIYDEPDPASRRRLVSRSEHWTKQKKIGGGGFGSIWLEKCIKGGRDIEVRAVKQLEKDRRVGHLDYNRELETIAKFSHWKYERCFVKSFGWYESPNCLYIAMEYLDLGDLYTYLQHNPPLPEDEVKQVASQILDGLCLMHDNQFAHRDLKPSNILLKSCPPDEWWLKIADFGISKRIEEDRGRSSTLKGTLGYIAPELHGFCKRGSPYAADIWAVGEIMFEMLTKQPTFKHLGLLANYTRKLEAFPSNVLLAAKVSKPGIDFILSHMQPDPADRISAENALLSQWIAQELPCSQDFVTSAPYQEAPGPSALESMTERFAEWDTITSQSISNTFTPRSELELESLPRPMSSKETEEVQLLDDKWVKRHTLEGHSRAVWAVAFSPDTNLVTSISDDYTIRLWDPVSGTVRHIFKGSFRWTVAVAFSSGNLIAFACEDRTIRLWDRVTGATQLRFEGHSGWITALAFSLDGKLVASASDDRIIHLWDSVTGDVCRTLKQHSGWITAVAFSPDGTLVTAVSDHTIRIRDSVTGTVHHTLKGHFSDVRALAVSSDGKLVVSSSDDRTVRLWDSVTGAVCHILKGHSGWVRAVKFSPDNKLVISASDDRTIRLWDSGTGVTCHILKGHSDCIKSVAVSSDGKLVASASDDRTVQRKEAREK